MPPGTTPPLIIRYSVDNVPILQLGVSSSKYSEQALFDYTANFARVQLATVQGASMPYPYGGKIRQIEVDIDPQALQANGLTPADVSAAINAQSLTLPSGTVKIGDREYGVLLNNSPGLVADLGNLPIRRTNGATIYIRDVAQVRDGSPPQTNIVRQNGHRGVLLSVLKNGDASTLDVIRRIKAALPRVRAILPPEINFVPQLDQSIFVRAALNGVMREAVLAALLTAAMILLFLGTWRNTLVVVLSIPLSIFCSIACLAACGQTINSMTLGGLALAVGMLVDDATVTIENIERNLGMGKSAPPGHPRRRPADRRPGLRLDPVHLHRLRADLLLERGDEVSFQPARPGGHLRHAGVLLPFADRRSDLRPLPARLDSRCGTRTSGRGLLPAGPSGLHPAVRAVPRRPTSAALKWCLDHRGNVVIGMAAATVADRVPRRRFSGATSSPGWTPARSACTCAPRPERGSRRPSGSSPGSRTTSGP